MAQHPVRCPELEFIDAGVPINLAILAEAIQACQEKYGKNSRVVFRGTGIIPRIYPQDCAGESQILRINADEIR